MDSLPEINLNPNTAKGPAKKAANQARSSLKSAGSLVAKQAEKTKLVTVTLPRAYAELGKRVYKDASRREEFAELFQSVDKLLAERKRIAEEGKARSAGTTVTEKAKKVAADAADLAKSKAIDVQAFQAFAKLGEAVFQKYGESAGAADTVEPVSRAVARRDQLDRDVGVLNASAKGKWNALKQRASATSVMPDSKMPNSVLGIRVKTWVNWLPWTMLCLSLGAGMAVAAMIAVNVFLSSIRLPAGMKNLFAEGTDAAWSVMFWLLLGQLVAGCVAFPLLRTRSSMGWNIAFASAATWAVHELFTQVSIGTSLFSIVMLGLDVLFIFVLWRLRPVYVTA